MYNVFYIYKKCGNVLTHDKEFIFNKLEDNGYIFMGIETEDVVECKIEYNILEEDINNFNHVKNLFPDCMLYQSDEALSYFSENVNIVSDEVYTFFNGSIFVKYYESSKQIKVFIHQ